MTRGDVHLVRLDPTRGSEIHKTRPSVIVSPNELNEHLLTVIVAPMTTAGRAYPWRIRSVSAALGICGPGPGTDGPSRAAGEASRRAVD
jgi:mRNA-degrading endonuclease toxin of MazEF toxin-antitoxin module